MCVSVAGGDGGGVFSYLKETRFDGGDGDGEVVCVRFCFLSGNLLLSVEAGGESRGVALEP